MSDTKEMLRRARDQVRPPEGVMDELIRRRDRKQRNRRITAAVVGIIVALISFVGLTSALRTDERPGHEPTPTSKPEGTFVRVRGWIAYGNSGTDGIWAVDPTRPGNPQGQIRLSDRTGEPLAWSSDGSKLLVWRLPTHALLVLNEDGTETVVARISDFFSGATMSPDGSQVVYSTYGQKTRSDIYVVDAEGGEPRVLLPGTPRWFPALKRRVPRFLYAPAFSPDGTKVAYFDGMGDWGHSSGS